MSRSRPRRPGPATPLRVAAAPALSALALGVALVTPATPAAAQDGVTYADAVADLTFRQIGPTIMGGRIADIAVVEGDATTFYVGAATGGLWKTTNAGITFEPVFDDQATASIGDVTVAPSNRNVVWVGTGEPQNRQSSPWGNGVYRSTDAGRTWDHLGLEETHHVARIQVHPRDPDVAYVAAVGHLWGPNPERGVYRTTDGGATWEKVLYVDEDTGVIDLVMDPADPRTLFAATYQRRRRAWGFNGGGPGSGIWRTTDGGESWERLSAGLPRGDLGRIGLDLYRKDPSFVCAVVQADASGDGDDAPRRDGVYCSTDRGETWEHRSTTNNRPMYYSQIRIDPGDPERIYLGGSDLFVSEDGGRTFRDDAADGVHLDHHALWIDPADSRHLLLGGDGGLSVSWDRSANWYQHRNLPLAQFYEIGLTADVPYRVCGGLQDNGSWCAPSDTWSNQGVRTRDWVNVGSGDGFFTVTHPTDPDVMFAESQGGNLTRVDLRTMERSRLRPVERPAPSAGPDADREALRWNWDTPVMLSSHDPGVIYIGANVLFRSRDLGQTWGRISPDLTYAIDRDTLELMGVRGSEPMMSRNDGQSSYGNLTALAESPVDAAVLYAGADDGRLHVTRDGGATWTDVTGNVPGLPRHTYVTRLVASRYDAGTVFAAFDGHRSDDFAPYVYRSGDHGRTWRRITDGLPRTSVNALAEHPRTRGLLFAGNEVGAYVSTDGGGRWTRLDGGLPTVPVDDIAIHPGADDLVLGTHGRGAWIMDDIAPLQGLTADVMASSAHLFRPRPAVLYNAYRPQGWTPGVWEAETPPAGARLRFWLGEGFADDSVTVSIREPGSGTVVREATVAAEPGLNEVHWDMTLQEDDAAGEPMENGPWVMPGTYTARLEAGGVTSEVPVEVRLDPRADVTGAELRARQDAMVRAYRLSGPADRAEEALDRIREQLRDVAGVLDEAASPDPAVRRGVEALLARADSLDEDLDEASEGAGHFTIASVTGPPTADQLWEIERSERRLPAVIGRINALIRSELPALYGRVYQPGSAPDPGPEVPLPSPTGATP